MDQCHIWDVEVPIKKYQYLPIKEQYDLKENEIYTKS